MEILRRMEGRGGITFAEFMDLVLYHPQYGYYTSGPSRIGREGDFITSPELHPFFGKALALQILEMWRIMGEVDTAIVELGGGSGTLAGQIIGLLRTVPEAWERMRYFIVEKGPVRARIEGVEWCRGLEGITWGDG